MRTPPSIAATVAGHPGIAQRGADAVGHRRIGRVEVDHQRCRPPAASSARRRPARAARARPTTRAAAVRNAFAPPPAARPRQQVGDRAGEIVLRQRGAGRPASRPARASRPRARRRCRRSATVSAAAMRDMRGDADRDDLAPAACRTTAASGAARHRRPGAGRAGARAAGARADRAAARRRCRPCPAGSAAPYAIVRGLPAASHAVRSIGAGIAKPVPSPARTSARVSPSSTAHSPAARRGQRQRVGHQRGMVQPGILDPRDPFGHAVVADDADEIALGRRSRRRARGGRSRRGSAISSSTANGSAASRLARVASGRSTATSRTAFGRDQHGCRAVGVRRDQRGAVERPDARRTGRIFAGPRTKAGARGQFGCNRESPVMAMGDTNAQYFPTVS